MTLISIRVRKVVLDEVERPLLFKEVALKFINNVDYKDCIGKIFKTRNFGDFEILYYKNNNHVDIKFIDTGFTKTCKMKEVRTGSIKDPFIPNIFGQGFIGDKYPSRSKDSTRSSMKHYEMWSGMLERCYSKRFLNIRSTYVDCIVSDNFKSYTYFYEWCEKQVGFNNDRWCLDKDVLIKGNKLYSEDTCVFIPNEINVLFTKTNSLRGKYQIGVHFCKTKKKFVAQINRNKGQQDYLGQFDSAEYAFLAYKVAKEDFIKEVAENWKGVVDNRVYNALMNYEVEITD